MTERIHCHACGTDGLTHATFLTHAETCEKHPLAVALREARAEVERLKEGLAAVRGINDEAAKREAEERHAALESLRERCAAVLDGAEDGLWSWSYAALVRAVSLEVTP